MASSGRVGELVGCTGLSPPSASPSGSALLSDSASGCSLVVIEAVAPAFESDMKSRKSGVEKAETEDRAEAVDDEDNRRSMAAAHKCSNRAKVSSLFNSVEKKYCAIHNRHGHI